MNQLAMTYEPTLTPIEARVWAVIKARRGRANAIPMPDLAELVFLDPTATRRVQTAIHELRLKGLPIGSASSKPNGYFLETDVKELERTATEMLKRGANTIKAARALLKHGPRLAGQMDLNHGGAE